MHELVLFSQTTKIDTHEEKYFHSTTHGEVYLIQHYVIKFVSDWWQIGGFLCVLWFPPLIKLMIGNKKNVAAYDPSIAHTMFITEYNWSSNMFLFLAVVPVK